jgi:RHS repeat-associated protein
VVWPPIDNKCYQYQRGGARTTNPAPEGALKFRNTAQPLTGDVSQAYFETSQQSGDIMIAGAKNQEGVHTFAVAYVDNYGVFEQYAENGDFEFAYSNIGGEGKELKDVAGDPTYFYYIKDHLGSTRVIIDEQMEPSGVYAYAAYGKEKELNASPNHVREKFTGKELDNEGTANGAVGMRLSYFGKRYCDQEIGRWISVDPLKEFKDSYRYCVNPINHLDPAGRGDMLSMIMYGKPSSSMWTTAEKIDYSVKMANGVIDAAWGGRKIAEDASSKTGMAVTALGVVTLQPEIIATGMTISTVSDALTVTNDIHGNMNGTTPIKKTVFDIAWTIVSGSLGKMFGLGDSKLMKSVAGIEDVKMNAMQDVVDNQMEKAP